MIRPTSFFSDMAEIFNMAVKGRVYIFGSGENKINPIHGADLAKMCVDAVDMDGEEISLVAIPFT